MANSSTETSLIEMARRKFIGGEGACHQNDDGPVLAHRAVELESTVR
jgi:hypothetical protein